MTHTHSGRIKISGPMCPTRVGWPGMLQVPSLLPQQSQDQPRGAQLLLAQAAPTLLPRGDKAQGPRALGIRTWCPSAGRGDTALAINLVPGRASSSGQQQSGRSGDTLGWSQGRIWSSLASGGVAQPFWALPARCAQLLMPLLGVPRAGVTPEFPVLPSLPCSQGEEGGLKAETSLHVPCLLQFHF